MSIQEEDIKFKSLDECEKAFKSQNSFSDISERIEKNAEEHLLEIYPLMEEYYEKIIVPKLNNVFDGTFKFCIDYRHSEFTVEEMCNYLVEIKGFPKNILKIPAYMSFENSCLEIKIENSWQKFDPEEE